jgi:hypothetical protein
MKILKVNSAQLSNYEVLELLQEPIPKHLAKISQFQEFRTAIHTTKEFLKDPMMPCSVQKQEQIETILEHLQKFELTKMEKLMIINTRPINVVELMVLIEDCEVRFSQEQQQEILTLLDEHLPFARPQEEYA